MTIATKPRPTITSGPTARARRADLAPAAADAAATCSGGRLHRPAEPDYLSRQFGGNASIALPGRNTTVALAYSHSFDLVCDKDNGTATPEEAKALTGADPCDKSGGIFGKDRPGMTLWRGLSIDTAQ